MTSRRPSLPPMPDLSHLTEDERKVIEDVLRRQREEEEKEHEVISRPRTLLVRGMSRSFDAFTKFEGESALTKMEM
ncbi:hypothetical protein RRG08_062757 [Elysia crispata]|uniref:RabBD domain-containing protein n=1 Tax=Elysia crispata TaxID=231223 RepID=A0AAE1B1V2_9GAST|nr:hypothetical protein RRG08_062757 [Elysia crispata]